MDNFFGQLRLKGAHNLSEIDTVVLEPYGKISVIKKPESLPITKRQMNLPYKPVALSVILVYDGKVDKRNLHKAGLSEEWLTNKLMEKGISDIKNVFITMLESDGTIYVSI